jgi:hypothetical protein
LAEWGVNMEGFNYKVVGIDFDESHYFKFGELVKFISEEHETGFKVYENKEGIQQILSNTEVKKID